MSVTIPDPATTDWVPLAYGAAIQSNVPACRVYRGAVQSVAASSTVITFDGERFDTDNIHDNVTNNTRLTCRTAGKYHVGASIDWVTSAGGTMRDAFITINGGTRVIDALQPPTTGGYARQDLSAVWDLAVGDYLELSTYHDGTGAVNVNPEFWMTYVGPGLLGRGVQNLKGTSAQSPAANAVPPGTTYYNTDTSQTYLSDGTTWTKTSGVNVNDLPVGIPVANIAGYPNNGAVALGGDGVWRAYKRDVAGTWAAGALLMQHGQVGSFNCPAGLQTLLVNLIAPWPSVHAQFYASVWPNAHWSWTYQGSLPASASQGYIAITNNGAAQTFTVNWVSYGY